MIPSFESAFFEWLWRASWQSSVLILLVFATQRLLRHHLSPRWASALWILVIVRLLWPWQLENRVSVFNLFQSKAPVIQTSPSSNIASLAAGSATLGPAQDGSPQMISEKFNTSWFPFMWLGGMLILPLLIGLASWRVSRAIGKERPLTITPVLELMQNCKEEMNIRVPLTLIETAKVTTPMLFGYVRPRLLLPAGLIQKFSRAELRHIFLHELAHLKRRDIALNWIATLVMVLHWFNPLVWFAFNRMRADRELACDSLALSCSKEPKPYAETILKLLEHFHRPAVGPGMVGIVESKNQIKRRLKMIINHKQTNRWPLMGLSLVAALALLTFTEAQSPKSAEKAAADAKEGPPRIVSTSPKIGQTDVDPALTEMSVTFDQDMAGGFSWTGGGPDFPAAREGEKIHWRDKRTCVFPVKLEAAHYYRIGINSTSHHNFKSAAGVPARPASLYFTTTGAGDELKSKTEKPQIIAITPANGASGVDPATKELRVTFNTPMNSGFSWTGGPPSYPATPAGARPYWSADKKTCALPVELKPGTEYRLGLNSPSHKNFQSVSGVPLDPVVYTFTTKAE